MKNLQLAVNSLETEIQNLVSHVQKLDTECGSLRHKLADLTRDKDLLLLKKETSQSLSNP